MWTRCIIVHLSNTSIMECNWFDFGCLTKVKEPNLSPLQEVENEWIHGFVKGISTKWNTNILVQHLNSGHWFYF